MKEMNTSKKICYLAMGVAMYVVFGMTVKIPLISHIQTDLGYMVYGAFLNCFGVCGIIVGVLGCLIESMIFSGWIPVGWMVGQVFIGLICGVCYKGIRKRNHLKYVLYVVVTAVSVFIGVGLIKTIIECKLYGIPFEIKVVKNLVAALADTIPMAVGSMSIEQIRKRINL